MSYPESSHLRSVLEPIEETALEIEDDNNSITSKSASIKYKKYRPITQSYYGVHHHKTQAAPEFAEKANSIRSTTMKLNNIGLQALKNEDEIDILPLARYYTTDGNEQHNDIGEDENYLNTTNSQLLQSNLNRLLKFNHYDTIHSNNSNSYRPSEAFGLLFSKRASSLFDNQAYDDAYERRSLLNDNQSQMYSTFDDKIDKQDEIPKVDYNGLNFMDYALLPLTFFPPVFLGLILNFLNAVSYGMIIFPTQISIFKDFGPDGVSMFLVSTAISQLVYSSFGSGFACAAGGFMLEVVPFLHIIVHTIIDDVGQNNPNVVVATTMVAYALSSIITGIVFFLLGYFKLGSLVGFFPRHILVGCIGGVGYFLCQTALEVVSGVKLNYFELSCWIEFFQPKAMSLWVTSICLAVSLKLLQRKINSPILLPLFYMMIPIIFFSIVKIFNLDINYLREIGWLFPKPNYDKPFYNFYLNFDFYNTNWSTLPKLIPIILALTFFGILHVPINVPAVAVTTKTDVYDVNYELIGHGWSNTLSGLFGSLQNYLMYSSSVLFFKSGGNDRFAGMMLAFSTLLIWMIGNQVIEYIPCIILGSVIFHLGLELFKEGVYETFYVMTTIEYITIWIIVISMALLGFVEGVFIGIVLACLFFVYLYSQKSPIRNSYSGKLCRSTVRRVFKQKQFLDSASNLIHVLKLQGFMFFGTIDFVESKIRSLISEDNWDTNPISFLVIDFTLVTGVDFSAAEAFIRIHRLLNTKKINMVLCGLSTTSEIGMALHAVGIWNIQEGVSQTFETLNNALEWCENKLIEAAYLKQPINCIDINTNSLPNEIPNSPRTKHIDLLRKQNLVTESNLTSAFNQPLQLLMQIFSENSTILDESFFKLANYFTHKLYPKDTTLWSTGDLADCLYILESGLIKVYSITNSTKKLVESILPGAMVGELALFTNMNRPYTTITDSECSLWYLSKENFDRLAKEEPQILIKFIQLALAYSVQEINVYSSNVLNSS